MSDEIKTCGECDNWEPLFCGCGKCSDDRTPDAKYGRSVPACEKFIPKKKQEAKPKQPEDKEREQTIESPTRVDYRDSTFYARDGRNHPIVTAYGESGPGTISAQEGQYMGLRCFIRLGGLMLVLAVPRKLLEKLPQRFAEDEGFMPIPKLEAFGLIEQIGVDMLIKEYQDSRK